MRSLFVKTASAAANVAIRGVEKIVRLSDSAELRTVDAPQFDKTIKERGRLVIVDFYQEDIANTWNEHSGLEHAIKKFPAKVLVAKVDAGRNIELMDRLQVHNIPTYLVYRDGKLLEVFKGKVDQKRFIQVVQYHLDHPHSKPYRDGYIGPLKRDWLPDGIQAIPAGEPMTPLSLDRD